MDGENPSTGFAGASIVSSVAAADPAHIEALGFAEIGSSTSTGQLNLTSFDGQAVSPGDVIVKFTYVGDANLDGSVNSVDEAMTSNGYYSELTGWSNGAFVYTDSVNPDAMEICDGIAAMDLPPGSLTLSEGEAWPALSVETPAGTPISSWQVNWNDGEGSIPFDPTDPSSWPNYTGGHFSAVLSALGADGNTIYEYPAIAVQLYPLAPSNLAATVSLPGEVDLSWTNASYIATGYTVSISYTSNGTTTATQQTFGPGSTSGSITGLTAGVEYTFSVVADNQVNASTNLQSSASNTSIVVPSSQTLLATGIATVDEGSSGTLTLSSGSSSNIRRWTIQWIDDYGDTICTDTITGANGTDAYPTALTPGLTALVTAYNSADNSYVLPAFNASTIPIAPTNLAVNVVSSTEIDLAWDETSEAAEVYNVLRSDDGGTFNLIAQVDPGVGYYGDTSLTPSDSAEYEVEAQGDANNAVSSPATASSATTPTGAPVITSLIQGADNDPSAVLTWTYQGQDYSGFEVEAENQSAGTNFQLVQTYDETTTFDSETNTLTCTATYGVNGGDTYLFRVRADHNDGSVSNYNQSEPLTIEQASAPTLTVTSVTIGSGDDAQQELEVGWTIPSTDTGGASLQVMCVTAYGGTNWNTVWYGSFGTGSGAWPADFPGTTTPYYTYDPGVFGPGTYYFRISTVDAYGNNTQLSSTESGTIDGSTGTAPTVSACGTTITASWPESLGPGAQILEAQDGDGVVTGEYSNLQFVGGTLNSESGTYTATFASLQPGTQYDFSLWTPVAPANDYSPETFLFGAAVTTTGGAVTPNAPDGLTANWNTSGNTQTNHYAHLSWKNESDNETGFELERSTDPTFTSDENTKVFIESVDETTRNDLTLDYDHIYYYRVRSFNVFAYSSWSGTASLTPGPIIVGFYGADTAVTFPNAGNETIAEMQWTLVDAGFEVKVFESVLGEKPAKAWLLSHLTSGLSRRTIEIFGHSWGGTTGVYLAQDIGKDPTFPDHTVNLLLAIDPVTLGIHWPGGGGPVVVPANVVWFHDWYQTNPIGNEGIRNYLGIPGLLGLSNLVGKYLNSNAQNNDERDYYDANDVKSKWHRVRHLSILDADYLEDDILYTLTGHYLQIQTEHRIL